ncbi:MAG: putative hydro-lyase [Candidatus Atribacteria bacterium]|nr:MAG: putative hydro-lyase [Candidatus Atribacteria bacterium]
MDLLTGSAARLLIRSGQWRLPTAVLAPGFVQANLVVLDRAHARDFEAFCHSNPKPLPLLEKLDVGSPVPRRCAIEADLRTDLPKYRVYEFGSLAREIPDLRQEWQDDWCAFLLGCSFTFDTLLLDAGIPVRHLEQQCNVPMYKTDRELNPVGPFAGNLVVSMRPIPFCDVERVVGLTKPLWLAHGEPVHIGAAQDLGIDDLASPDYGDAVEIRKGEVPLFWACGVTAQLVAQLCNIPLMVTHAPGHMFITDLEIEELACGGKGLDPLPEEGSIRCPGA